MNNFLEMAEENPCVSCSAPCCRMVLIPHKPPTTFLEMDYIRYMVGFKNIEMIVSSDGQWQVCIKENCQLLDEESNSCTVHNTPRQPKVCVSYNPYQCWYKRNWTTDSTQAVICLDQEAICLDMEAIEVILPHILFDSDGNISEVPSWEKMRELIHL